tara:strand:+ start:133908 stop:134198 length:291 start_codon:yes stop_codon:yes gene_type:complete
MTIEEIVKEETEALIATLEGQITDPAQRLAIAQMTTDLAMIPIRMARGEDTTLAFASLQAEAAMRGVTASLKAQEAVQKAWMNIIIKIIAVSLATV